MLRNKIVNYHRPLTASVNQALAQSWVRIDSPWMRENVKRKAPQKDEGNVFKGIVLSRILGCYHRREEDEYAVQLFNRGKIDRRFYELSPRRKIRW